MENKAFASKVLEVNGREIMGISAVAGVMDAGYDVIFKGAFVKTIEERAERVKHLWQHDFTQPPTATITELREVSRADLPDDLKTSYPDAKGGLLVKRFYLESPRGEEILAGLKSAPPAITEMSIGYDPIRFDYEEDEKQGILIRNLREIRLWDTSDVNWGMNAATVANFKSIIQYKDTGVEDREAEWKAPALGDFLDQDLTWDKLPLAEKNRIAAHFAMSKNNPPQSFEDLILPHHAPSKSGIGKTIWFGVKDAMGELVRTCRSLNLSMDQVKALHGHLSQHYAQFKQEPVHLAVLELLSSIGDTLNIPQVKADAETLGMLQKLNDRLSAEPLSAIEQAALTLRIEQEKLLRKMQSSRRRVAVAKSFV